MSRRINERRRRVLYQSRVAPPTASTAAARAEAAMLREARQPASAFGSRVGRHLRGRWFSLVPVSRLAIALFSVAVLGGAAALMLLHHLSLTTPSLANREAIARIFRVDRA
ncbi:MAG: hypothetical protein AAGJ83_16155, partial [Planctomycetota bacterium]